MESEYTRFQKIVPTLIGKLVPLPSFNDFSDDKSDIFLLQCFEKDIAWSIAEGLPDKENTISF